MKYIKVVFYLEGSDALKFYNSMVNDESFWFDVQCWVYSDVYGFDSGPHLTYC